MHVWECVNQGIDQIALVTSNSRYNQVTISLIKILQIEIIIFNETVDSHRLRGRFYPTELGISAHPSLWELVLNLA